MNVQVDQSRKQQQHCNLAAKQLLEERLNFCFDIFFNLAFSSISLLVSLQLFFLYLLTVYNTCY